MRCTLLFAMATSAMGLQAGLTLTAPATLTAGSSQILIAEQDGAEDKQPWSWSVQLGGRPLSAHDQPISLEPRGRFANLTVPRGASGRLLLVEVRRGGEGVSQVIQVLAPEDGSHAFTKARTVVTEETKAPSVPAIGKLPDDCMGHMAHFLPDPLRYVNKVMNQGARQAARKFKPGMGLTDDKFLRYAQRHPNLRELTLDFSKGQGDSLTGPGVLQALEAMPNLERLAIIARHHRKPTERFPLDQVALAKFLRARPRLTHLTLDLAITDAFLSACGNLTHLELRNGSKVTDAGILPLLGLRKLTLQRCPAFKGFGLPLGLEVLSVEHCAPFTGNHLPTTLRDLKVDRCPAFEGDELPVLGTLEVSVCPRFSGRNLKPGLHTLKVDHDEAFTGADLPAGLKNLVSLYASAFTGMALPPSLESLEVHGSPGFSGNGLPVGLQELACVNCANFTVHGLPDGLRKLRVVRGIGSAPVLQDACRRSDRMMLEY